MYISSTESTSVHFISPTLRTHKNFVTELIAGNENKYYLRCLSNLPLLHILPINIRWHFERFPDTFDKQELAYRINSCHKIYLSVPVDIPGYSRRIRVYTKLIDIIENANSRLTIPKWKILGVRPRYNLIKGTSEIVEQNASYSSSTCSHLFD